jgi:hypothetical protein
MKNTAFVLVGLAFLLGIAASAEARGGYSGFRNFKSNPPRVGEKAPLLPGYDEAGKKTTMARYVGRTHMVVIFGALT